MTIKQQGGIFGRNPTFNNVDVDGNLSLSDNNKAIFGSSGDLEVYSTGSTAYIRETGGGDLQITASDDVFIRGTDTANYMARFRETNSVDLYFNNVRKFQTTATGISVAGNVAVTDGGGIDFSATSGTGTSELFDDYEEGTFTPAAARAVNFVVNVANYTKIGRLVSCEMNVQWDSTDNSSGNLTITGLPFTSTAGAGYLTVGSALINGTDVNTDIAGAVVARLAGAKTEIVLAKATATALNIVQANECNSATELTIQLNYTTAS